VISVGTPSIIFLKDAFMQASQIAYRIPSSVCRGLLLGLTVTSCLGLTEFPFTFQTKASNQCMAAEQSKKVGAMTLDRSDFGNLPTGEKVTLFTLTNTRGHSIQMIDYGAILVSVNVPDRNGELKNVTAGFQKLDGYVNRHPYFGATVGRFANRIAKGKFSIGDNVYTLATNNGPNHLHGGVVGFDKLMWTVEEARNTDSIGLKFQLTSPDGQEGYPGTLNTTALYTWDNNDQLTIKLTAETDKATHVNLTNHMYLNLAGPATGTGSGKITDHELTLNCDQFIPVDDTSIPIGHLESVAGTAFDFRKMHKIGERIEQVPGSPGYDHCYVVNGKAGELRDCAKVVDPKSGRAFELKTTQPGVQLYTGNFLQGTEAGAFLKKHEAFCLETQHFPDSPNQKSFPSTLLMPGEKFQETTTIRFYTVPE
jgi:aldose 1-epimerase